MQLLESTWGVAPADVPSQAPFLWLHEVFLQHVGDPAAYHDLVAHAPVAGLDPCLSPYPAFWLSPLSTRTRKLRPG